MSGANPRGVVRAYLVAPAVGAAYDHEYGFFADAAYFYSLGCSICQDDCNENGIPDTNEFDSDGDGAINDCDDCPWDPEKTVPGLCGCGVDDSVDQDADGIADCIDERPGVDDAVFAPECGQAIPAMTTWGVIVLALVLMTAAKVAFRRVSAKGSDAL